MKKTKILTVLGVLLAMGITACGGNKPAPSSEEVQPGTSEVQPGTSEAQPGTSEAQPGTSEAQPGTSEVGPASSQEQPASSEEQPSSEAHVHSFGTYTQTKAPTCTEAGSEEAVCACGEKDVRAIPALGHDYSGEGAVKVDHLEEEGVVPVDVYKCARCNSTSIRWDALKYDASSNDVESKSGGIRFGKIENVNGTAGKGTHIIYKFNSYEANAKAGLAFDITPSSNGVDLFNSIFKADGTPNDNSAGYVYNENNELVPAQKRYALYVNDVQVEIGENNYGGPKARGWYNWPVEFPVQKGENKIEIVGFGGYRAVFYNFAVTGLGAHEHEANYVPIDSRLNSDDKTVFLGQDSFLNNKAIEIAFKDFSDAPANPSGTNPWYMAKGSFATWKVSVDKAIEGAKLYFSLECSSDTHLERHLFNEAKWNEEHPDAPVALPGQSPDTTSEDAWRYSIFVGNQEYPILNNGTMAESGVKAKNTQTYVYFGDINLAAGENVIKLSQNNIGYRMKFNQNVRIVFNTDAVIDGTHAHMFTELVSETPATCEHEGSKVMKCVCGETETVTTPKAPHTWVEGTAVQNGDSKDVIPMECSVCHAHAAKISVNDYSAGAQFDSDNDKVADAIRPKQNTAISYKITAPVAGNYKIIFGMKCNKNGGTAMSSRGFKVSVGGVEQTVVDFGTATADSMGLNATTVVDVTLVASAAMTAEETTIAITCAGYRLLYGGFLTIEELPALS